MSDSVVYTYQAPSLPGMVGLLLRSDGTTVPCDLANMDYQAFLAWLTEGNPAPEGWTGPVNPPRAP